MMKFAIYFHRNSSQPFPKIWAIGRGSGSEKDVVIHAQCGKTLQKRVGRWDIIKSRRQKELEGYSLFSDGEFDAPEAENISKALARLVSGQTSMWASGLQMDVAQRVYDFVSRDLGFSIKMIPRPIVTPVMPPVSPPPRHEITPSWEADWSF